MKVYDDVSPAGWTYPSFLRQMLRVPPKSPHTRDMGHYDTLAQEDA